ncbi:MAG: undecaprenyl-diphosphate phosphatase [Clostridia bacterium]|nr:undecaprenyl-diphosphate phosphatase [Clostridia bacterium]
MILIYIIIGIVQGLTEFLPVSSSGHILLISEIFNVNCDIIFLSVVAHLGTLLSVIICMRKRLVYSVKHPFCKTNWKLLVATLPCVVFVLLFNDLVDKLYSVYFLVGGFLITGILLIVADLIKPKNQPLNFKHSLLMGLMQGVAILPGISRSGSTMAVGMMAGADKNEACEFTFLMSIPIIIASAVFESVEMFTIGVNIEVLPAIIVFIISFIFGILSIKLMLKVLKNNKLYIFSIYLLIISAITLLVVL